VMKDYCPDFWIHGHVHESHEYRIGQTTVSCNPRGYVPLDENDAFVPVRTVALS